MLHNISSGAKYIQMKQWFTELYEIQILYKISVLFFIGPELPMSRSSLSALELSDDITGEMLLVVGGYNKAEKIMEKPILKLKCTNSVDETNCQWIETGQEVQRGRRLAMLIPLN